MMKKGMFMHIVITKMDQVIDEEEWEMCQEVLGAFISEGDGE